MSGINSEGRTSIYQPKIVNYMLVLKVLILWQRTLWQYVVRQSTLPVYPLYQRILLMT